MQALVSHALAHKSSEAKNDNFAIVFIAEDVARLTLEEKCYYFLQHAPEISPEKLKKLIGKDKVIEQAFHELDRFYWTKRRNNRSSARV